jgi:hypothetical protein
MPRGSLQNRRGARVAEVLSRSWRADAPPLELRTDELAEIETLLLSSGAGALAAGRLRGSPLETTPMGQRFQALHRYQVLDLAVREQKLPALWSRLRAAGVEAVMGKGWAVARGYPEPGQRPCGDIDLYVRRRDYERARSVVAADYDVDLHRGLAELDDRDEEPVFARSRRLAVGGVDVRILGSEDHLRLVALHALRHGLIRPLWLCDVAVMIESLPSDFDWNIFQAGDATRTGWATVAIELAAILGASFSSVPQGARAQRLPGWLVPAVLAEWGSGRLPHGARAPMSGALHLPSAFVRRLLLRWPNPVEATVGLGRRFGALPPVVLQIAESTRRAGLFAARLAQGGPSR